MNSELCADCQLAGKCEAVGNENGHWPPKLLADTLGAIAKLYPDCPRNEMVKRLGQIMPPQKT